MRAGLILLLFLAAGCAPAGEPDPPETPGEEARTLTVENIASGPYGPQERGIMLAPDAGSLARAAGVEVPDAGEGVYAGAFWGERRTGGHTVRFESAILEGNEVTVRLSLRAPGPGDIVTQALTHPYAVAVIRDVEPSGLRFRFVDQAGRELDWPVRTVP
ncbi:protease complex subunit PrcB family protein [Rubrobacter taiwanensis]|jgi:hypothetical protein|uniref:Protease complex subunit PrcB family protein n=1 Tax=Rubrobacter taiwanensis TaxID=185139 RepID=A0A4R1BQM2_9ACTN|nr:protease complex subunit PrcB family protein [Rubrobacter taiwanensis]TCJ19901.1 protease complex subunit PrcB family protein [Rubrobacter taiwanensis]